jgi:hypothetical protein
MTLLLDHLTDLAVDREAGDRRIKRVIKLGRTMGVPVSDLADAARLSTSRVHAILASEGLSYRPLEQTEVEWVLENANRVAIVPANGVAYKDYDRYSAYICQPRRTFRDETDRLGFYADQEIKPEFPRIGRRWEEVVFNDETIGQLRASGDADEAKLADIIEHVLANQTGGRKPGFRHKVMLLSGRDDRDTLTIAKPIPHLGRGRGQAYVRRQRYTSEAALLRQPGSTDELNS